MSRRCSSCLSSEGADLTAVNPDSKIMVLTRCCTPTTNEGVQRRGRLLSCSKAGGSLPQRRSKRREKVDRRTIHRCGLLRF